MSPHEFTEAFDTLERKCHLDEGLSLPVVTCAKYHAQHMPKALSL